MGKVVVVLFFVRAVRKDLQREDERFGKKSRDQMTLWTYK